MKNLGPASNKTVSRLWKIVAIVSGAVLALVVVLVVVVSNRMEPMAKEYVETTLARRFGSDVTLGAVGISLLAGPVVTAHNIQLRHRGRTDVPPLIEIKKLVIGSSLRGLMSSTRTIHDVEFQGLVINVPPKRSPGESRFAAPSSSSPAPSSSPAEPAPPAQSKPSEPVTRRPVADFMIERIKANGAVLKILPKEDWREPLVWDLQKLTLQAVGPGRPMEFKATLRNAKPPGDIETSGKFGPWNGDDPGQTPVEGAYQFRDADLSVFNGIAGKLASDGRYTGVLERLDVTGTTDTPDFRLESAGNRVPLKTEFHAIVDGTTGDTLLLPVKAQLGSSSLYCRGGITGTRGVKGKTIDLDVSIDRGRLDDILRLTVRSKAPMSGAIKMRAKLVIPPGKADIIEKMRLAGTFSMDRVKFNNAEIQAKINELSQRARGEHDPEPERVASHFDGRFRLGSSSISLDELTFEVPGAAVLLAGNYGMRSEVMDFKGKLRMQAKVSQTMRGWKSLLLKAADPFFSKEGAGAVLPIAISGTREQPKFGLNFRGNKDEDKNKNKDQGVRARKNSR